MTSVKDSVILITGATSGIGKAAALSLALKGAKVAVHGRDKKKIADTVGEINEKAGPGHAEGISGDLSSLKEVKAMAGEFISRYGRLDVLINNAGGLFLEKKSSRDGFEITFAVNYLSHFLLTNLLLDLLKKSAPARVIHVSSEAHTYLKSLDFGKLTAVNGYRGFKAYSAAKICVNLFAFELARRVKEFGIDSNALHPGVIRTGFGLNTNNPVFHALMQIFRLFLVSPEDGALTTVYLASSDEVKGVTGKYFDKCREAPYAKNSAGSETGRKLWELSEEMVKNYF